MCPTRNDDESIEASVAEFVASRLSSADEFDSPDWTEFAMRVAALRAQQQRSQQLIEYCDETVAAIRASLERTLNESGSHDKPG
jgi:ABC-type Fe3+-hydroxamate transport system substrate-binding protein